jgi:hypothetical protein
MELVIAIGFFAVASAVCAQLFADAHTTSQRSSNLSMAVVAAESAAEEFKATSVDSGLAGGAAYFFYDGGWQPVEGSEGAAYQTVVTYSAEDRLLSADIAVYEAQNEQPLYQITTKKAVNG